MRQFEKRVETLILCFLQDCGLRPWKAETIGKYNVKQKRFHALQGPFRATGCPDILCVLPDGRLLAIEVKSKTGKSSPAQLEFARRINESNGIAFVAKSIREVFDSLKPHWIDIENHSQLADLCRVFPWY